MLKNVFLRLCAEDVQVNVIIPNSNSISPLIKGGKQLGLKHLRRKCSPVPPRRDIGSKTETSQKKILFFVLFRSRPAVRRVLN
jgi:hypothetical protein